MITRANVFVLPTWDAKTSLPIILMLHGAGADENTYLNMNDGLLPKLAAGQSSIFVSPLGFTAMGAYGNPLLKANGDAAKWFVGPGCGLCREPAWSVEKKG